MTVSVSREPDIEGRGPPATAPPGRPLLLMDTDHLIKIAYLPDPVQLALAVDNYPSPDLRQRIGHETEMGFELVT